MLDVYKRSRGRRDVHFSALYWSENHALKEIIASLGKTGDPRAVDALVKLLDEELYSSRAVDALLGAGDISNIQILRDYILEKGTKNVDYYIRKEFEKAYRRFMRAVAQGQGISKVSYKGKGPHPIVILVDQKSQCSCLLFECAPEGWWDPMSDPLEIQLVAEVKARPQTLEEKGYTYGSSQFANASISRTRLDEEVILFEAATGRVIASKLFHGGTPRAFKGRETISASSLFGSSRIRGDSVECGEIVDWMRPYVEEGAEAGDEAVRQ
jgi:hypothetical protein